MLNEQKKKELVQRIRMTSFLLSVRNNRDDDLVSTKSLGKFLDKLELADQKELVKYLYLINTELFVYEPKVYEYI